MALGADHAPNCATAIVATSLKVAIGGAHASTAMAVIGPIPGVVRRLVYPPRVGLHGEGFLQLSNLRGSTGRPARGTRPRSRTSWGIAGSAASIAAAKVFR